MANGTPLDLILNLLRSRRSGYGGMAIAPFPQAEPAAAPPFEPQGPQPPEPGVLEGRRRGLQDVQDRRDLEGAFDGFRRDTDATMEEEILRRMLGTPLRGPLDAQGGFSGGRQRFPDLAAPGPMGPALPRPSAASGLLPAIGDPPEPTRISGPPFLRGAPLPGGMDDTRFMGPRGEQAPAVDFGAAVLPPGAGPQPSAPTQQGMSADEKLRMLALNRGISKAGSHFANIRGPASYELEARGVRPRDFSIDTSRIDADEERIRRGDFEDPNSPASQMARQMIGNITGRPVPEGTSAAVIMSISPVFDELIRTQIAGSSQQFNQALGLLRESRAGRTEERADERLELARTVADRAEAARRRPTPAQAAEAGQIDVTLNALKNLIAAKEENDFNTGPITNAFETALNFIGAAEGPYGAWDYSTKNAFKAQVLDLLAQYQKSISGQAISEPEARRLRQTFPAPGDDDKTFVAKAKNAIQRLEERQQVYLDTLEKAGKDVSQLKGMAGGANGKPGGAAAGAGAGQVWVKRGDQVRGPVSRAEAQRMLENREIDAIVD